MPSQPLQLYQGDHRKRKRKKEKRKQVHTTIPFLSVLLFAGLFDLNVPLTKVEIHLLTRLLDPDDTGEVDYTQLKLGLQLAR